jgi:hypothetical protein
MPKGGTPRRGRWAGLDAHRPQPWRQTTKCIFCGIEGVATPQRKLTHEHVYSNWTRRFVPRTLQKFRSLRATTYAGDRTEFVFVNQPGDVRNWQVLCVCEGCNNGWMRQSVDERARPILIPLITGQQIRLLPAQQKIVAAWAAMKAMVAEYGESEFVTTHHMQRKYMMRHRVAPATWGVWIAHYRPDPGVMLWQSAPFVVFPDQIAVRYPDRRPPFRNSQATTQIVGQLLLHVVRCPHPRLVRMFRFKLSSRQALFQIWPPRQYSIVWPSGTIDDATASYISGAVRDFMLRGQDAR